MNVVHFLKTREHGGVTRKITPGATHSISEIVEEHTSNLTKNQSCQLSGLPRATFLMDFSPDGTKCASTHGDHTVRVTDIASGKCTHVLTGHPRTPWCVAFHPSSNQILASGCLGGEVRIWDLHGGGSEVWHSPSNGVIAGLAFHPMDHVLVFATGNTIYFWDWSQPEPFAFSRTNYEFERIRWVRFDPLGHYLYTGIANNTTVHREEPSNVLHINDTSSPHPSRLQQFANRRRYQQVIQRFHDYQQERLRGTSNRQDEGNNMEVDGSDLAPTPAGSSAEPESSLLGRHFHSVIENRLRRAGDYASSITETTRRAREIVSSLSSRRQRTNPYRLSQLRRLNTGHSVQPGTWSPPPRVWSAADEEDMEQEDIRSGVAGATTPPQLSEIADVGAQRPTLVRPSSSSIVRPPLFPIGYSQSREPVTINSPLRSWINNRRNNSLSENNTSSSGTAARSINYGANLRAGLRFEHTPSRPVSGPNSIVSSPNVSSLRLHSSLASSAFRAVLPSTRLESDTTPSPSLASSSHTPCAICRTFNPSLVNNNNNSSTANNNSSSTANNNSSGTANNNSSSTANNNSSSTANNNSSSTANNNSQSTSASDSSSVPTPPATSRAPPTVVPTSSGLVIPRSRSGMASSSRLLNMMILQHNQSSTESNQEESSRPAATSNSQHSERTPKTDGASQTSGTMEQPECSDQGTDVIGLRGDQQTVELDNAGMEEPEQDTVAGSESGLALEQVALVEDEALAEPMENEVDETTVNGHMNSVVPANSDQNNNSSQSRTSALSQDSPRQEDLTSLTIRLERQVTELDRRITALRERFTERLRALHQDRERILNLRGRISNQSSPESSEATSAVTSGQPSQHVPLITITRPRDHGDFSHTPAAYNSSTQAQGNGQNTHLLEMFLRGDGQHSNATRPPLPPPSLASVRVTPSREDEVFHEDRSWHALQQRHLHPHYSVSILDDTINRPSDALHAAINRAIAGAFMGTGEQAVASNIIPQTHRIQRWDFTKCQIPDVTQSKANIVVPHCKLHNDASCDISQDSTFLATFVPSHRGFPDDNILAVFSLHPDSFAQCLFTKSFGPNAISVSLSPRNHCVMVGLAAKRLSWVFTCNQLVAQVYKLSKKNAGENSMKHMSDVFHPCDMDIRTHVSVNSARFMRGLGAGLVYGTNRGDLHICRHGVKKVTQKASEEFPEMVDADNGGDGATEGPSIRMNLMSMLGMPSSQSRTSSIATQTLTRGIRRTAGTQTDTNSEPTDEDEEEEEEV